MIFGCIEWMSGNGGENCLELKFSTPVFSRILTPSYKSIVIVSTEFHFHIGFIFCGKWNLHFQKKPITSFFFLHIQFLLYKEREREMKIPLSVHVENYYFISSSSHKRPESVLVHFSDLPDYRTRHIQARSDRYPNPSPPSLETARRHPHGPHRPIVDSGSERVGQKHGVRVRAAGDIGVHKPKRRGEGNLQRHLPRR